GWTTSMKCGHAASFRADRAERAEGYNNGSSLRLPRHWSQATESQVVNASPRLYFEKIALERIVDDLPYDDPLIEICAHDSKPIDPFGEYLQNDLEVRRALEEPALA